MFVLLNLLIATAMRVGDPYDLAPVNNCGPTALHICAGIVGVDINSDAVDRAVRRANLESCTLAELNDGARSLGLCTFAAQWSGRFPVMLSAPAIICVSKTGNDRHFVAVVAHDDRRVLAVDVPHAPFWIEVDRLRTRFRWDGHALHVGKDAHALEPIVAATRHVADPVRYLAASVLGLVGALFLLRVITRVVGYVFALR